MVSQMSPLAAALWGFVGAAAIEAWDLYGAIHRVKGFPWKFAGEVALAPYLVSVMLRVFLGIGMAVAFVASGQAAGPVGAVAIGIAAPKLLEQLARQAVSQAAADDSTRQLRPTHPEAAVKGGGHAP
jgi:hypothetical protein